MNQLPNNLSSFARFAEIAERQQRLMLPTVRQILKNLDQVAPLIEKQHRLSETVFQNTQLAFNHLQRSQDCLQQTELITKYANSIFRLQQQLQRLIAQSGRDQESLAELAERGWYLDPDMSANAIGQFADAIREDPEEVDAIVSDFFRERADAIRQELTKSYPERSHLWRDAFDAHCESKYNLSIPLFLAQADGIFEKQFPQKSLFISGQRESAIEEYRPYSSDIFFDVLLYPFSISTPSWESRKERSESFEGLNRHQVLHGESIAYGTEQNSLKAISLLSNLRWVLEDSVP